MASFKSVSWRIIFVFLLSFSFNVVIRMFNWQMFSAAMLNRVVWVMAVWVVACTAQLPFEGTSLSVVFSTDILLRTFCTGDFVKTWVNTVVIF